MKAHKVCLKILQLNCWNKHLTCSRKQSASEKHMYLGRDCILSPPKCKRAGTPMTAEKETGCRRNIRPNMRVRRTIKYIIK